MNINKQVSNLELSKKLEKLKVKQDSVWSWIVGDSKVPYLENTETALITIEIDKDDNKTKPDIYSAYTCAELGEIMLGHNVFSSGNGNVAIKQFNCEWGNRERFEYDIIEANCRAKMLVYLLKNKLINL